MRLDVATRIGIKKEKTIQLWNYTIDKNPLTDYTIGIALSKKWLQKERAAVANL
jgi:hypothetical protein